MKEDLAILKQSDIFKNMELEYIENIIKEKDYKIISYDKGDVIALEDSKCSSVGIVLSGNIEIQRIYESGRSLIVQRFIEGNTFGEAIVFSQKNTYPATILASVKCKIMFIKNEAIIELCASEKVFLENFMSLLSEKIFMFNNRVKTISFCSIRQKLSNFILEQVAIQKCSIVKLTINKKELAEYLGVQRPSLSRELINMQDDGIIECNKNEIKILDMYTLKETMCK